MVVKRPDREIDDLLNDAQNTIDEGSRRFPGMSYEEGIVEVIRWLRGDTDDHPYEEE